MTERNPVVIPQKRFTKPACPKCGCEDFGGRRIQGTVVRTCLKCGQQWSGGYGMSPADPDPLVPERPNTFVPPLRVGTDSKGQTTEERKKQDLTPDFKKGAPIPTGEE